MFQLVKGNSIFSGDFSSQHPDRSSTFSSRLGNMIYETINSQGFCILNNGTATHLGRPNCDNSAIDISFSSPNVIWNSSWSVLNDPYGSDHFLIIILITSDIPYWPNPNRQSTNRSPNKLSPPQFNSNQANWQLFFQLVDSVISNFSNNVTDSVEKYNEFTQILLDSAKKAIPLKHNKSNNFPPFTSPIVGTFMFQAINKRKELFEIDCNSESIYNL